SHVSFLIRAVRESPAGVANCEKRGLATRIPAMPVPAFRRHGEHNAINAIVPYFPYFSISNYPIGKILFP
ncbi:MAG TPA: hypothetical protein PLS19_10080, partial [bacterium]|nr:hypothetical protein [bacterium]